MADANSVTRLGEHKPLCILLRISDRNREVLCHLCPLPRKLGTQNANSLHRAWDLLSSVLKEGNCLKDIKFDTKLLVIMVRRDEDFFVPTGTSELRVGDQLLIISDTAAEATEQFIEDSAAEETEQWGMLLINHTWRFTKQKWQQIIDGKRKK